MTRLAELRKYFEQGFFGFWVRKYRVSYLAVILLVVLGFSSAMTIPKESSPAVSLGMISVSTSYPGTNPEDMDSLVTDKIYKEVKDIKGIDTISSTSGLGYSSVLLTLETTADSKDVMSDVRNAVSRASLPSDANTPVVTEIETNTDQIFSVFIYNKKNSASRALLIDRAVTLQQELEKVSGVSSVDLGAGDMSSASVTVGGAGNSTVYDVSIIIPKEKLDALGLTLASIASIVRSYNIDQPIGNFSLGEKKYDYRIEGKNTMSFDFLNTPLMLPSGDAITLGDIATIERTYKDKSVNTLMVGTGSIPYTYVGLTINKSESTSIFSASDATKDRIAEVFQETEFQDYGYIYGNDIADMIRDDYGDLLREGGTTLLLVFVAMFFFVGFKDSLFATLTLPLAFLATFILLDQFGYSLNFLTNFSFILSFGIAVDTIIVIVQAASAKLRIGYSPRSAIMLALREYAIPIIAGVSTTIVVFIPMMMLPGIMGKFLAYIPITIFGVLASGLVLALTVNSALYLLFVREKKTYIESDSVMEYADEAEKELLTLEREGKTLVAETSAPLRIRVLHRATEWYKGVLRNFLEHTAIRRISIFLPVVFFFFGFIVLAPAIGMNLFPNSDNGVASFTIEGPTGLQTEVMAREIGDWTPYFSGHTEIEYVSTSINGNTANVTAQLTKLQEREKLGEKSVFELESEIAEKLAVLEAKGLKVTSSVAENGPPGGKAVGLNLIAEKTSDLPELIKVSQDFQEYLKTMTGTKNVGTSSAETPGQFILSLDKNLLARYSISPSIIYSSITQNMNGIAVGTVENNGTDMDVVLKTDTFLSGALMEDVLNIPFTAGTTTYRVGDFVDTEIKNAIASVVRDDGKIEITVDADLATGFDTLVKQAEFTAFADSYNFPKGISYALGGENEENSDLIVATFTSFFLAIIVIFAILTLQFNSFSQPTIILYSVIMSLPFVMVGLLLTGNQFSIPFGIGFIAFTGIAVNHGIILIDAINENLAKGMRGITALVEAGSSRLEPMTLTTLTTALGMIPIATKDPFWSGMGFTIIFGIISASFLTLFVVKGIYYEVYMREDKPRRRSFFERIKARFHSVKK